MFHGAGHRDICSNLLISAASYLGSDRRSWDLSLDWWDCLALFKRLRFEHDFR